ncbi:signal recognition particle-docking protein FtsY [Staphylothermus marinus F1]|uniref:Signal recognition particle receptor FtsY n=1 Tax=Staphylothermus marinus (strain ATCC 43588 / DSM 3639 / JCM 9404 / F1) TaxID=399550 RepID=A3DNH8_STAMF|nr:signal recognition particle-docking protein FtsY [Staphylothermus marinus]ABN70188.1 signal recognition particle-docking protein FtsY [Staphylothermus marinus F1]
MFRRIKRVFSKFIDKASALLFSKEQLMDLIDEFKFELISNDVAYDVAEEITTKLVEAVENKIVRDKESLIEFLKKTIRSYFDSVELIDIFHEASKTKPYIIVFLGVNGVGKTTTIAKTAVLFRDKGFKPLMVAADTFRAGAQEQLRIHGERTGIPVFMGKYGADPASIAFDAIRHAETRGYDVVLIDTAGRMHTDSNLVDELRKIIRVAKPHRKILVVDALTGNDAIEQAVFFDKAVGVDAVIVTKVDAYEQGGVPLSIVYSIRKPIIMIGVGQGYKDLKPFNIDEFLDKILSVK